MEVFDALYHEKKIKFIGVRDERTGTHMADGYARASNSPGIILAGQNGPGATNLVTGMAQAKAAFSPVIALAGSYSTKDKMEDAFQGLDQQSLFSPVTKKTWTIKKIKKIPQTLDGAFKLAMKPRRGPICVNLPRNILAKKSKFNFNLNKNFKKENNKGKSKEIKKSVKIILQSKKPVIIVGAGIKNTGKYGEVINFSKSLNIPIVSSAGHGDAIPFNYKLYAGQMGPRGNIVASKLVKEADVILALGTRLGFNSTFYSYENISKNAKIIHVELEKTMIGKYFPIAIGIYGDANTVIKQMLKEIKDQKILSDVNIWTNNFVKERLKFLKQRDVINSKNNSLIQPKGLFKELRSILPKNSAITLDAGTLCLQATDAFEYYDPPSLFTPLDFGLVGFSFACGLGVKVAKPNKTVVSLMGDGGFGMTISELSTAVEHQINTITIVMNNKSWGAEKAYQKDFFDGRYLGSDIKSPPFDKVAEIYGAKGFKVQKISEVCDAVKLALKSNKPVVIDVDVDPKALYSFRRDSFKYRSK